MSRIGVIGTGHIAAPMVRFLSRKGHDLCVSSRNAEVAAGLARDVGAAIAEPQEVIDRSEILLLCLRPNRAHDVLQPLDFAPEQQIVSVMAGISAEDLRGLCAPASTLVQTVPLGFVEQGGCPLAAYGEARLLKQLFEPENPVIEVTTEAALNSHFAVCAMIPGLLDLLATSADWLASRTGDPVGAEAFTLHLASGFLAALETADPGALHRERDALATPNTLSLQMVEALRRDGAPKALHDALTAIDTRLTGTS